MSIEQNTVICPAPTTTRGQPYTLTSYEEKNSVVYGNGLFVYLRSIEKPNEVLKVHRNKHPVTSARVSPSQKYCASGDKNGNVVVWALDNVTHTVKLETQVIAGPINDIAWSGDNQRMVAVGEGRDSFGAAFLVDGGSTVGSVAGHTKTITACDFRKERPFRIVTSSEDQEVNFYEGPPFKFKLAQKGHSNIVNCVRYSPSGDQFVSVSSDKQILLYDGKTGEKTGQIPCDHAGSLYSIAWSPCGKKLATASADKTVKIWNVESKSCEATMTVQDKTVDYMQMGITYVKDSPVSVTFNGDINVFGSGSTPVKVLRGHMKPINTLTITKCGAVVSASSDPSVLVWADGARDSEKSTRPAAKKMHGSVISASTQVGDNVITVSLDDTVGVTNLKSGEFKLLGNKVSGGPNGVTVAGANLVITTNKGIFVVSPDTAEEKSKVATSFTPTCCAASASGKFVVVGAKEKKFVVYAVKGDKLEQVAEVADQHKAAITAVAWGGDSKFATADSSREIMTWEYADSVKQSTGPGDMAYHTAAVKCLSFSPDGKHLASGSVDTHVLVWNLADKSRIKQEAAHLGGVNAIGWNSANEVITAGQDCAIRTWTMKF